ncbi:uncharacterized protein GGS22DRAFT_148788 [Annulohypoxylon maeteangense]|uniref:uncharacterized protein n=1 Tax=Annulohypoxylon maeteangense TaxID=1927788 RepID=UPI0020089752|nr:uncharacterized protein GGS22DRAFT_148788 [Annulohypoxylon maeteangense]KAI0889637.1 hypothetical protein GGS22DRAFT_148788 [Annulohypoxylon maeteangense]
MKVSDVLGLCLALAVQANAQFPYFEAGDDGEGITWGGWGSGGGSDGGDSSGGYGSSSGTDSGFDVYPDFDVEKVVNYGTAHGVMAALCFAVLFPAGAILMRIISGRHAWWIHGVFQVIAYFLYIAAAGLGIQLVQMIKIPNGSSLLEMSSTNAHPIIGIVILAVLALQPPLGVIHHSKFKRLGRRTAYSHLHLWIGRLTLTLGIINGGLGLRLAHAEKGVIIAYSVVAGLIWLLWLLVAVLGEYRRRSVSRGQNRGRGSSVETRAYVADLPPPRGGMGVPQAIPSARETRRRNRDGGYDGAAGYDYNRYSHRQNGSSDDPSPPYTPGPLHTVPPGYTGAVEGVEMRPVKNSTRGSGSMSSFSSGVPRDEDYRV